MEQRSVRFDMNQLAQIAAASVGLSACLKIEKLPEGNFNKTYVMTMEGGAQVVAKVPNPNAGYPHLTTASEVATMRYVRRSRPDFGLQLKNRLTMPGKRYPWIARSQSSRLEFEISDQLCRRGVRCHGQN